MKQNITLDTLDIALLIALCESAGTILKDKKDFERIAIRLRKQTGVE